MGRRDEVIIGKVLEKTLWFLKISYDISEMFIFGYYEISEIFMFGYLSKEGDCGSLELKIWYNFREVISK